MQLLKRLRLQEARRKLQDPAMPLTRACCNSRRVCGVIPVGSPSR
jgi:hypothetical protein